jgi:hypothetical protein
MADTNERNRKASSETTEPARQDSGKDAGQSEVQAIVDKENEQGFAGIEVDPTPNENYTLQGVASGAPTPETDADTRAKAQAHAVEIEKKLR